MAIWELSRVDIVTRSPEGVTGLVAVVTGWEPEPLRLAQLAVKLAGLRAHGERCHPYAIRVVSCDGDPPPAAVALVRRAGGTIEREDGAPIADRPGEIGLTADGDPDWAAVHAANAAHFARQHGLDGTLDSVRRVDEVLDRAYKAAWDRLGEDGELPEDGDLAILAGAYASEVLLAAFGGAWLPPDAGSHLPDLRIGLGRHRELVVNAAGKVRKFLRNGPEDALHPLAVVVAGRF